MDPLGFFREKAVQRILDRAAQAASTPVSIHFHHEGEEGARVFGTGRCEACQYVSSLSGGRMACRASRTKAANQAPPPPPQTSGLLSLSSASLRCYCYY